MQDTKTIRISANRQKKQTIVAHVSEKVIKAKGMVFTQYQGLTHQQLEQFRRALKKLEAEYVATKNTLLKIALEQTQNSKLKTGNDEKTLDSQLSNFNFQQPTATLFMYNDIVEPLKQLARTIKNLKLPVVKFGILEGKIVTDAEVAKLATLPALPVLRAQLLGQMQSPISGLHRALNWNLQKLVLALKAIETKKQA